MIQPSKSCVRAKSQRLTVGDAATPAIALWLQSRALAGRVAMRMMLLIFLCSMLCLVTRAADAPPAKPSVLGVFSNKADGFDTQALILDSNGKGFYLAAVSGVPVRWKYGPGTNEITLTGPIGANQKAGSFIARFDPAKREFRILDPSGAAGSRPLVHVSDEIPQRFRAAIKGFGDNIHEAALHGDLESVKSLLKANPELVFSKVPTNDPDRRYGYTPLHAAAEQGHKEVVELLLANNADVSAKFSNGWTPLHLAAAHRRKDVVELLLTNRADVNAKGYYGHTPLHVVATSRDKAAIEIAGLLLASKAEVRAKGIDGDTPLHLASRLGCDGMAKLLLAHKADVNAKDNKGETPLRQAAGNGRTNTVELLRQYGGHE